MFVPERINGAFIGANGNGATLTKSGKYKSVCNLGGCVRTLGYFDTQLDASLRYKQEKELHIRNIAEEYKDKIPIKLYGIIP